MLQVVWINIKNISIASISVCIVDDITNLFRKTKWKMLSKLDSLQKKKEKKNTIAK